MRCCLFSFVIVSLCAGADWPEFRGPTGQGIVANGALPLTWSATKNIAWKQTIPGNGWSSPIVVNQRVYVTSAVPAGNSSDLSLRTFCLDAATGKTVWNVEVFRQHGGKAPKIHRKNSHASPTPLWHDDRLYVHFGHQGTACLDPHGKVRWRNQQHYAPVHGNGGSPIVAGNSLVFNCDGGDKQYVVALDRHTGKELWHVDRNANPVKGFSFCTPLLIMVKGQHQIISAGSNVVSALDPADGKEIWRVRYQGYSVVPRPVYGHGLVFICTGYDAPKLLAIRADGQGDVTDTHVVWTARRGVPHTPSLLLVGDELYLAADKGILSCLDARSGDVHWSERVDGDYSASPLLADGKIYLLSEQGSGLVFRAGKKFEQLARNEMDERALASCAAADGALYLRTENHLYRIEAREK